MACNSVSASPSYSNAPDFSMDRVGSFAPPLTSYVRHLVPVDQKSYLLAGTFVAPRTKELVHDGLWGVNLDGDAKVKDGAWMGLSALSMVAGSPGELLVLAAQTQSAAETYGLQLSRHALRSGLRVDSVDVRAVGVEPVFDSAGRLLRWVDATGAGADNPLQALPMQPARMHRGAAGRTAVTFVSHHAVHLALYDEELTPLARTLLLPFVEGAASLYVAPPVVQDDACGTTFVLLRMQADTQAAAAKWHGLSLAQAPLPGTADLLVALDEAGQLRAALPLDPAQGSYASLDADRCGVVLVGHTSLPTPALPVLQRLRYEPEKGHFNPLWSQTFAFSDSMDRIYSALLLADGKIVFGGSAGYLQAETGSLLRGGQAIVGSIARDGVLTHVERVTAAHSLEHSWAQVVVVGPRDAWGVYTHEGMALTHATSGSPSRLGFFWPREPE